MKTNDNSIENEMIDIISVESNLSESYSLSSLIKKHGIKNQKAHSAAADTKATQELFLKQIEYLRKKMNIKWNLIVMDCESVQHVPK